ncbi:ABC transporter permease [Oscillatoria sp. FACHB-1406]|uniref:ABC transporter permease n=1 Tax=Oscillatoria sp. FACHB-1406 TaxID=2692846 RepID=UPI00168275D5|nr:ABC transporter permease [Oscillatoria sp. FACHB-1406]MBD2580064.1 ABC transporter permease [Oscillatoria sp. FACHB-1406]
MLKLEITTAKPKTNKAKKATQQIAFTEVVGIALEALWSNKLRTGLTMLGVTIGIASVTAISSIGEGMQKNVGQQMQSLGTNVLQVMSGAARSGNVSQGAGSLTTLTWEDKGAIEKGAPSAKLVSATLQRGGQVVYSGTNINTTIYGSDLNYPEVRNTHPASGRYFTQEEFDRADRVAVIGSVVQQKLFGNGTGLNEKIRVQGENYLVIGVMESKGSQGPMNRDDTIYIPLTTMSARIVGNNALQGISVSTIWIESESRDSLVAAQFQVTNILRLRHNIYNPENDDFRVMNQSDLVSAFSNIVGVLRIFAIAIAGISLLVGGIGIANIMLVSVVERTREIGIRKALGATNSAILIQFAIEAIAISTLGGVVGAGTGVCLAYFGSNAFGFPFIISRSSIVVGFILSMFVGFVAGVIPARTAARLEPIAALRSE